MTDQPSVKLLPGERVLIEDIDGMLILTTRRVRFSQRGRGQSIFTSITLDAVASCGLTTVSYPRLLLLAILVILGAIWYGNMSNQNSGLASMIAFVGVVLIGLYFSSRKGVLKIASAGDAITVKSKGISREKLIEFIETLEQAKADLYRQLH